MKSPQYVCLPLTERPKPLIKCRTRLAIRRGDVLFDFGEHTYVSLDNGNTVTYIVIALYIYSSDMMRNTRLNTINLKINCTFT